MTLNDYQNLALRTAPERGKNNAFDRPVTQLQGQHCDNIDLVHAALGLASEVGELADALKKAWMHGRALDRINIAEEIGDVLWYCAIAARALGNGMDLESCAALNIKKLYTRYPEKYSDERSAGRDTNAERAVLEGGAE